MLHFRFKKLVVTFDIHRICSTFFIYNVNTANISLISEKVIKQNIMQREIK